MDDREVREQATKSLGDGGRARGDRSRVDNRDGRASIRTPPEREIPSAERRTPDRAFFTLGTAGEA